MPRFSVILRFAVSTLLASALVIFGGGWLITRYVGHQPSETVGLTVIRGISLVEHIPGREKKVGKSQEPMINGFVQVGYQVGADGRPRDIHVIRAEPPGMYDQAAIQVVAAKRFKPPNAKGTATPQTLVVHFQVPTSALAHDSSQKPRNPPGG